MNCRIQLYSMYLCVCVQVLYSKKDSEGPPSIQVADGEGSVSLLLGVLQKYTVYVLQVLAYTRMGDGPPSNPVLLRTKEDGRISLSPAQSGHWPCCPAVCSTLLPSSHLCSCFSPLYTSAVSTANRLFPPLHWSSTGFSSPLRPLPQPRHGEHIVYVCVFVLVCTMCADHFRCNHGRLSRMPATRSSLFE